MARFKLEFKTDNAAFSDGWEIEAARILREVADKVERGHTAANVRDYNGNTIGHFDHIDPNE